MGQENFSQNCEELKIDPEMLSSGVKVNYYFHCKTQLWLFSRFITLEQESDLVMLGKILETQAFRKIRNRNLIIDNKISLDFVRCKGGLLVFDIKKSSKFEKSHYYQVLYYLWYLKNIKGITNVKGVISYPTEKKRVEVILIHEKEVEMKNILDEIKCITSLPTPPKPIYKNYCRKCAYFEFCWV